VADDGLMLEVDGIFQLTDILPEWSASLKHSNRLRHRLNPPSNDAGMFIDVCSRRRGALAAHEARDLVAAFVSIAIKYPGPGTGLVLPQGRRQQRAVTSVVVDGEEGASGVHRQSATWESRSENG